MAVTRRDHHVSMDTPGTIFCLLLGVSSDYAQPITGQVTEVTCPVIGQAQPDLTSSKGQKTGPDRAGSLLQSRMVLAAKREYSNTDVLEPVTWNLWLWFAWVWPSTGVSPVELVITPMCPYTTLKSKASWRYPRWSLSSGMSCNIRVTFDVVQQSTLMNWTALFQHSPAHYGNQSRGFKMRGRPLWPPAVPRLAARPSETNPRGSGPDVLKRERGHVTAATGVAEVAVFGALQRNVWMFLHKWGPEWRLDMTFLCEMMDIV